MQIIHNERLTDPDDADDDVDDDPKPELRSGEALFPFGKNPFTPDA